MRRERLPRAIGGVASRSIGRAAGRGFTLVEVLVALMVVALGLAALMTAVSGAARTSGFLRDKTVAQWIAMNRIAEVRLTVNRTGETHDTGEIDFANRHWHYDTRYFDTSVTGMKRIVVRVWAGDAKTKSNPVAESTSFLGSSLTQPGGSNRDWAPDVLAAPCQPGQGQGGGAGATAPGIGAPVGGAGITPCAAPGVVTPGVPPSGNGTTPTTGTTPTGGTPGAPTP